MNKSKEKGMKLRIETNTGIKNGFEKYKWDERTMTKMNLNGR
jgi:hypothetical protein